MDFKVCWYCGKLLEKHGASPEHFIAQSLGGKINRRILHQGCNNKLSILDYELAAQLNQLSFLTGIENIRNKNKSFNAISSNNEIVIYSSKKKTFHEIIIANPHGKDFKLQGEDIELLKKKAIEKAVQLYPGDPDILSKLKFKPLQQEKQVIYYSNGRAKDISFSEIGGPGFYRAMCKIAIDFAIYWGIDIKFMKDVIAYTIHDNKPNYFARFYAPEYYVPNYPQTDEISHYVALLADEEQGSIFCYIELFSVECCLVRLNNGTYSGPTITKSYKNDLVNGTESKSDENALMRNFERFHTIFTNSFESDYIDRISTVEIQKRYDNFQRLTLPTVEGFQGFDR
jgi:hypothetical protein